MLKPSSLFGTGAILCRRKEIRLFGEADSGKAVRVELKDGNGKLLAAGETVAEAGRFMVCLPPVEACCNCSLKFEAGQETVSAVDILIGDVYLAGGQSNMELALVNADEGKELISAHRAPMVRYYNVPQMAIVSDEQKKAVDGARWKGIEPGSGADMSAVAYFFAMNAHRETGVPIGIIDCYWGGTSVTCWIEESRLLRTAEGKRYLEDYEEKTNGKSMETFLDEERKWKGEMDVWNDAVARFKEAHPGCEWNDVVAACGYCPWNPPVGPGSPYRPAGLADSMLKTVVPATLTGILYYQGETDADLTDCYEVLLTELVFYWRELFEDEYLPFLNVQLPMWIDEGKEDTFRWPMIRLAQARIRDRIRNSGIICMMDQGEFNNIHPTNKRVVGDRLWELAKQMIYGMEGKNAPRALYKYTVGNELTVVLSAPVVCRNEGKDLLEIADVTGQWVPASFRTEGDRLILTGIEHPVHARYGNTDYAIVRLFGENGLPLEPFML